VSWMTVKHTARLAAPMGVAFVLSGCFATQQDIRVLQGDLMLVRNEAAAADSARQVQLDRVLRTLAQLNDSLNAVNTRLTRFRSDMAGSMTSVEQQLLQIQELTGQSQRKLQEVRASLEERQTQMSIPPAGAPPGEAPVPGPNELYRVAREQYNQGSHEAARGAFMELLKNYPKADIAPDATYYIAQTYAAEGNSAAADSVYNVVVTKYPKSMVAPMALFKRANLAATAGNATLARRLFNEVISKYPRSDEASLARDRIQALNQED
jgi:tol-pal system protein YbgF